MIKYHWNNIFHNYVMNIVTQVLEGKYPNAIKSLYEDDFIQDFMLKAISTQTQPKNPSSKKGYNLGYLGHVKKIAEYLMKSTEEIQLNVLESAKWQEFCRIYLDDELEKERKDLGGVRVKQDTNATEEAFDFSIDEIRTRFSSFLNPDEGDKVDLESNITNTVSDSNDPIDNQDPEKILEIEPENDSQEFVSNNYWKMDMTTSYDADDLLAELMK